MRRCVLLVLLCLSFTYAALDCSVSCPGFVGVNLNDGAGDCAANEGVTNTAEVVADSAPQFNCGNVPPYLFGVTGTPETSTTNQITIPKSEFNLLGETDFTVAFFFSLSNINGVSARTVFAFAEDHGLAAFCGIAIQIATPAIIVQADAGSAFSDNIITETFNLGTPLVVDTYYHLTFTSSATEWSIFIDGGNKLTADISATAWAGVGIRSADGLNGCTGDEQGTFGYPINGDPTAGIAGEIDMVRLFPTNILSDAEVVAIADTITNTPSISATISISPSITATPSITPTPVIASDPPREFDTEQNIIFVLAIIAACCLAFGAAFGAFFFLAKRMEKKKTLSFFRGAALPTSESMDAHQDAQL